MSGYQLTSCKFSILINLACLVFLLFFMNIFAWNSCGLGMSHKKNSIRNRLINNNIGICFLLETKKNNCCDSFIRNLWNIATVKWAFLESIGKSGGIIAMWDSSVFEVSSVEFGGQWINLCGTYIPSSFNCMIIGVYVASSVKERADMWEEITTLKFAFELPLVVLGDFNETLHAHERSSGHLNSSGSTSFRDRKSVV